MKILVINCGSSSLKYQLIDMTDESVLAKGLCERIGIDGSKLTHQVPGKDKYIVEKAMPDHKVAIGLVLDALQDAEHGVVKSTDEIAAVGHRVLHAGTKYCESIVVNDDVKKVIRECFDLGPLHNPANLMGIEACEAVMPGKANVAVWDTAFGMAMPEKAYLYAIPHEYYEKYSIRRYGFHGTSHRYVSKRACDILGVPYEEQRIITAHVGNGGSIAAVKNGSYLNRQPYGFLVQDNSIYLVQQEDAYTDNLDAALDLGIVMLHFSAVASQWAGQVRWELSPAAPDGLPEGLRSAAVYHM